MSTPVSCKSNDDCKPLEVLNIKTEQCCGFMKVNDAKSENVCIPTKISGSPDDTSANAQIKKAFDDGTAGCNGSTQLMGLAGAAVAAYASLHLF